MKYVVIIAVVILIVRIDSWLRLFDRASDSVSSSGPTIEIQNDELDTNREIIPVAQDQSLKQSPKETFFSLLSDFRVAPEEAVREKIITFLMANPKMFNDKLDSELEALVFRLRDHLNNNEPQTTPLLLSLMDNLKGENQAMVRKFFSLWMEIDMGDFLRAYSQSKDSNCLVAQDIGFNIPEEEKINEYYTRQETLEAYINTVKNPEDLKEFARKCLLVLNLKISKLTPPEEAPVPTGVTP